MLRQMAALARCGVAGAFVSLGLSGCAAPSYAVRPTPMPVEAPEVLALEREISRQQAALLIRNTQVLDASAARARGLDVERLMARLGRVSERPRLAYRVSVLRSRDFNAAALADGRVFVTEGMLDVLQPRPRREDELAFVLAHELAHISAQHVLRRLQAAQSAEVFNTLVGLAARGLGAGELGGIATQLTDIVTEVALAGYSQEQELEADQLGIRYVIRAGYHPQAALEFMADTATFDRPVGLVRTHPYTLERRNQLERYLTEAGVLRQPAASSAATPNLAEDQRRHLLAVQQRYPKDSVSWQNLQRQLEALE